MPKSTKAKPVHKKPDEKPLPLDKKTKWQIRKLNQTLDDKTARSEKKLARATEKVDDKIAKLKIKNEKRQARSEAKQQRQKVSKLAKRYPKLFQILTPFFAIGRFFRDKIWRKISNRVKGLTSRRPHRSFYLTPHADAKRSVKMRGYFSFVHEVWSMIWKDKWLFTKFLLLYSVLSAIIIGLMSQENFAAARDALDEAQTGGGFGRILTLFSSAITGSSSSTTATTDSGQQIMAALLFLYGWLILVWLLRRRINGDKVKLRDGLYSGGSPVLATLVVLAVMLLQLLPFALVLLAYSTISAAGWINSGIAIENMAAWCAMAVTAVLTLYWISSSFIALIVVTLPGMYPFATLRAAGDLVVGRRLKLVFRLIFMALPVALAWIIILTPAILIDSWLKLSWQPLVPIVVLILTTLTVIWCAAYIYLLYRRMVDDPEPPVSSAWQQKRFAKKEVKESARAAKKNAKQPGRLKQKTLNMMERVKNRSQK